MLLNLNVNWRVDVDPFILKTLKRIPRKDADKIANAIEELAHNPYFGDTHKLAGQKDAWRRRIGSYRLIYDISPEEKRVDLYDVLRRGSNTY